MVLSLNSHIYTSTFSLSHFLIQFLSTTPAPKKKLKILSSPTLRTICSHCKTLLISYSLVFMFSLVPNPLVTLHNLVSLCKTLSCVSLQPPKESRLFPVLVVSRVVFIPLLMLCNVQSRSFLPVYFAHDGAFTAIMALFSLSSGYFVCLSMSYAPQWVQTRWSLTLSVWDNSARVNITAAISVHSCWHTYQIRTILSVLAGVVWLQIHFHKTLLCFMCYFVRFQSQAA